jgi:hypothetical protein
MRRIAAMSFSLAITAGCASTNLQATATGIGTVDAPINTTIEAVRSAGAKYDGKYVRVRGLLNRCSGFDCALIPLSSDRTPDLKARRLRISFSHRQPTLNVANAVENSRVDIVIGFLYRFSEITVEGRYDYTCDSSEDVLTKPAKPDGAGKPGKLQEITVCTDAATNFYDATVIEVHRRWPSTAFVGGSKLIPLSSGTAAAMAAVYKESEGAGSREENWQYRAFVNSFEDGSAHFCACLKEDCTGQWPTEPHHLPGNPMNPYTCSSAKRTDGVWRFQPSFDR